jgi:GTP-binding protein HflX
VLNKVDRLDTQARHALVEAYPDALLVCAHDPADIARVHAAIAEAIDAGLAEATLTVPYDKSALCAEIRGNGRVVEERFVEAGAVLRVRARGFVIERWKAALHA